jgi:hypothetical protein
MELKHKNVEHFGSVLWQKNRWTAILKLKSCNLEVKYVCQVCGVYEPKAVFQTGNSTT